MQTPTQSTLKNRPRTLTAVAAVVAALALAGCNKAEQAEAKAEADTMVAQAEQKGAELKAEAGAAMESAREKGSQLRAEAGQAMGEAKVEAKEAAQGASEKVSDAVITTTVNAELARDDSLSALKINVDTEDGRVALRGTAPDAAARDRATQLAAGVKGVSTVDNQLVVEPAK